MDFKDGRIQGFKLKFKSLEMDTERYLFTMWRSIMVKAAEWMRSATPRQRLMSGVSPNP